MLLALSCSESQCGTALGLSDTPLSKVSHLPIAEIFGGSTTWTQPGHNRPSLDFQIQYHSAELNSLETHFSVFSLVCHSFSVFSWNLVLPDFTGWVYFSPGISAWPWRCFPYSFLLLPSGMQLCNNLFLFNTCLNFLLWNNSKFTKTTHRTHIYLLSRVIKIQHFSKSASASSEGRWVVRSDLQ